MAGLLRVTEDTFGRRVLRAGLPVLVCFGARACPGRRAMGAALARAAEAHAGRLLVAMALLDDAPLLAEQCGVAASPTLMVFQHGERQGQLVGFIPDRLVALLAAEAARGGLAGDVIWSPVEEQFEDVVLIPLLQAGGLRVERQVACRIPNLQRPQRGRIDLLVFAPPEAEPLTLIESKRQIRGDDELQLAVGQAWAYAQALGLPSFVVAAPRGLWAYRVAGGRPALARHLTSLELHHDPGLAQQLLRQLR